MDLKAMAQAMGKLGGQSTYKKYGASEMARRGKMGMAKRWAKHVKKTR